MKVQCINQNNYKDITVGNEYEVVEILENFYHITANSGNVRSYNKKYFELVAEPVIEDEDEIGVEEEPQPEFTVSWNEEDDSDIDINVNENRFTLPYYQTAGNCGVASYHGVNYLYENCDKNDTLFKDVIKAVIELVESQNNTCMLIFSTNCEYPEIWDILNEVMDFSSEVVENPNSDMDVRLWIKYTN